MKNIMLTLMISLIIMSFSDDLKAQSNTIPKSIISNEIIENIKEKINTNVTLISIEAQNERYNDINQNTINKLDEQWKRERELEDQPLIASVMSSPLSIYLTQIQASNLGLYAEIFVVDANGLNVGQSSITSDFWQGDEDKYKKTFLVSKNAVFIDEPEYNEETKTWRTQVCFTISKDNTPIGVAIVEFNLTELNRRLSY